MDSCDVLLKVPSADTPRIQETQMLIGHIICEIIEKDFVENPL
jgi:D-sedoheptulose 7-phosphate isomerase